MDARFQVSFTPLAGVLFAFPSRYLSTIGRHVVFRLGGWSPRIRTGFHVSRPTWDPGGPGRAFGYGAFTRCGRTFQSVRLTSPVPCPGPATPDGKPSGLAWCAFARHYSRNRVCFPLLWVLRCFTSPGLAPQAYLFNLRRHPIKGAGFPHSEIRGSKPVGGSPRLIAAFHVLRRLMMPRHPSCARIRLARYKTSPLVTLQFSLSPIFRLSKIKPPAQVSLRCGERGQSISNPADGRKGENEKNLKIVLTQN